MMTTLFDLVDNTKTDKNTCHSYLPVYQELFAPKRYDTNNVLEIGIGEPKQNKENGGSIKLWHDYFTNSKIYSLDIIPTSLVNDSILNKERITLYTSTNAYDVSFIENTFIKNNIKFDILIDDGPHTLDSMIFFVKHYLPLLKDDGIFVIEDIPDMNWIQILTDNTPEQYRKYIKCADLRRHKDRWDDIMFIIQNKS